MKSILHIFNLHHHGVVETYYLRLMMQYCLKYLNLPYDNNGSFSSKGKMDKTIVQKWIQEHNFILSEPPKSTGKELFGEQWLSNHFKFPKSTDHDDNLANLSYFTAKSIALNIHKFHKKNNGNQTPIYISGGGIKNKSITTNLNNLLHFLSNPPKNGKI